MAAVKFEGVDVLDCLGKVVELHTQHYKDDFDTDKELMNIRKQSLWLNRLLQKMKKGW